MMLACILEPGAVEDVGAFSVAMVLLAYRGSGPATVNAIWVNKRTRDRKSNILEMSS